jgi:hypothetical protein
MAELTTPGSHVAVARGYAAGTIIEPGEPVPAGVPIAEVGEEGSGHWMKAVAAAEAPAEPDAPAA